MITLPWEKCVMMLRACCPVVQVTCRVTLMICVSKHFARVAFLPSGFLTTESNKTLTWKLNKDTMLLESHTCKFQHRKKITNVGS